MTDDVAEMISLSGKALPGYGSKHPFLQMELCKVLFGLCRKTFEGVTETAMRPIIGDFLHQAKVRIARRSKKLENSKD
ncbi:hypothetical protein JTE90_024695 [Oedothorax gibbosus]|uniref:Uncharacterized protein n=1 Tax=Oedothorax gibbosus TaxID=931172 RepID=A0AAV6U9F9_9ARAC|nr:hypothetical protein JTE90_024695 [Oedothorax gibbosus]